MSAAIDDARFVRFTFAPGQGSPFDVPHADSQAEAAPPAALPPPRALPSAPTSSQTIRRLHISQLTPERFDREHRSCGVPLIIQGALQMGPHWELQEFVSLFEAEAAYQVRIHGGDSFATTPDMWRNKKSHARHVVWTSPQKFADTIATGIAARYARCAIQTRAVHPAHGPFSCP